MRFLSSGVLCTICSLSVLSVFKSIYQLGASIAKWSDADQVDYVFLPLVAAVVPYTIAVTVVAVALGNGWLKSKGSN